MFSSRSKNGLLTASLMKEHLSLQLTPTTGSLLRSSASALTSWLASYRTASSMGRWTRPLSGTARNLTVSAPLFDSKDIDITVCILLAALFSQKNDEGVRIINHCSFPEGRSINDHNSPDIQQLYPYSMAQPKAVIHDVLDFGRNVVLLVVKIDLDNAFKLLPVRASAWYRQVIRLNSVYFVDGRLLFGDSNSAHLFVYFQ